MQRDTKFVGDEDAQKEDSKKKDQFVKEFRELNNEWMKEMKKGMRGRV